jgi:hypothetical protein
MRKPLSHPTQQPRQVAVGLTVLLLLGLWTLADPALGAPTLWGYGVKSCKEYLAVSAGNGSPASVAGKEYGRYREWLAGLVTGLNLATGTDVLGGAELDAALTRIGSHCRDKPADDFFNASMSLIRSLGQVKGTGGKGKKD